MAPSNQLGKRVKLTQVRRPFVVGTTAVPFSDANPKPPGTPDNHTHSWQVFVKGLEDTDITYWVRRVQFKLHESIPNYVRSTSPTPYPSYASTAQRGLCDVDRLMQWSRENPASHSSSTRRDGANSTSPSS